MYRCIDDENTLYPYLDENTPDPFPHIAGGVGDRIRGCWGGWLITVPPKEVSSVLSSCRSNALNITSLPMLILLYSQKTTYVIK